MDTNFKKFNKSINFFLFRHHFFCFSRFFNRKNNIPMTPHDSETTGKECQIITMPNIAKMAPMTKKAMIGNRMIFKRHPKPFPKPSKRNSKIAPIPSRIQPKMPPPTNSRIISTIAPMINNISIMMYCYLFLILLLRSSISRSIL